MNGELSKTHTSTRNRTAEIPLTEGAKYSVFVETPDGKRHYVMQRMDAKDLTRLGIEVSCPPHVPEEGEAAYA